MPQPQQGAAISQPQLGAAQGSQQLLLFLLQSLLNKPLRLGLAQGSQQGSTSQPQLGATSQPQLGAATSQPQLGAGSQQLLFLLQSLLNKPLRLGLAQGSQQGSTAQPQLGAISQPQLGAAISQPQLGAASQQLDDLWPNRPKALALDGARVTLAAKANKATNRTDILESPLSEHVSRIGLGLAFRFLNGQRCRQPFNFSGRTAVLRHLRR